MEEDELIDCEFSEDTMEYFRNQSILTGISIDKIMKFFLTSLSGDAMDEMLDCFSTNQIEEENG